MSLGNTMDGLERIRWKALKEYDAKTFGANMNTAKPSQRLACQALDRSVLESVGE